jgi:four helix bundle protein
MKEHLQDPRSEGRDPKEIRSPKSEEGNGRDRFDYSSDFWTWGDEPGGMLLREGPADKRPLQDLEERTAQFGEAIIRFAKKIPRNPVNNRLIDQLVGAGTSVGANFCEADDSVSGKDFKNKIGTCRKESRETMFFLRMVATAEESLADEARPLWREAKELNLIFGAIWRK